MKFLFNYTKLFLWSIIYYFQPKDIFLDILIKNIQDSGCIAIKFTQWILPKLEMIYDLDSKKDIWFSKLEQFYEYCNIHDINYTKKIYNEDFSEKITDDYLKTTNYKITKIKPFFPKKKLKKIGNNRGTYTIKTEFNDRTCFSGPVYLPWYFILIEKNI